MRGVWILYHRCKVSKFLKDLKLVFAPLSWNSQIKVLFDWRLFWKNIGLLKDESSGQIVDDDSVGWASKNILWVFCLFGTVPNNLSNLVSICYRLTIKLRSQYVVANAKWNFETEYWLKRLNRKNITIRAWDR
jgi:hypothetical protein